jgi:hypothetical protein
VNVLPDLRERRRRRRRPDERIKAHKNNTSEVKNERKKESKGTK